jgi:hypothetical protein
MNKDDDFDKMNGSFDNKYNLKKELAGSEQDNQGEIKKSKTIRTTNKQKPKKGNKKTKNYKIEKTRKVKFDNNVIFIDVECWKKYNQEQTADENFEAYFMDFDKEDKENINKNNTNGKKLKDKRDNVSCTCNVI